jgi:hypothetical protein
MMKKWMMMMAVACCSTAALAQSSANDSLAEARAQLKARKLAAQYELNTIEQTQLAEAMLPAMQQLLEKRQHLEAARTAYAVARVEHEAVLAENLPERIQVQYETNKQGKREKFKGHPQMKEKAVRKNR